MNIPQSLKINDLFTSLKKLSIFLLFILIIINIIFFYIFNGILYFLSLIIGNILVIWLLIPFIIWISKTLLIDKGIEIIEEVKDNITQETLNIPQNKIVRVIEKDTNKKD